jgi:HD superfamily phosphohydrolase
MAEDLRDRYGDDKWTDYTQFKDTVHGYIKIHKPLAKKIINTREFQRLKNVEQTGMGVLYPSATHNRFIHSLGVYHLGTIAFQNFKENIHAKYKEDCYWLGRVESDEKAALHWCVWEILFKLACLLHDIGHTPFSHSLEILYDVDFIEDLPPKLQIAENSRMNVLLYHEIMSSKSKLDFKKYINSGKGQHERMSALLILANYGDKPGTNFKEKIKDLVCSYVNTKCPKTKIGEYIRGYDFADDLEFMTRMIVGCPYKWESKPKDYLKTGTTISKDRRDTWTRELQLRNCIIKILNSSIDVDNLDYATRDTQYSGYANALVDIERLLNSFTVIEGVKCDKVNVDFTQGNQIHNAVSCTDFSGDIFNINLFGKHNVRIDESIYKNNIKITDEDKKAESSKEDIEEKTEYLITKTNENSTDRWVIKLSWDPMMTKAGKDRPEGVAHMYLNGEMKGVFTGKIYGKTYLSSNENRDTAGITRFFEFAFDKTSQSVVDGAISARNYEYLWIYAHHTITYQTNYLTMHMLKQYSEILYEKDKENILDKVLKILTTPLKGSTDFFKKDAKNDERDIDKLFYDLYETILTFSPIRRLIIKKNKSQTEFAHLIGDIESLYKNTDLRKEIQGKKILKSIILQIKKFLWEILEAHGENVLFRLMELYYNLNARDLNILKKKRNGEYLKEIFYWITILLNEYYAVPPRPRVRRKLIDIFKELVCLAEGVIKNENTEVLQRAEIILYDLELKEQKSRLLNRSRKYMCDVIAMLDKKTINNLVFFRSSDDDLNAYYHSLENELFPKNEHSLTSKENEFLVAADEYFSRNFATAMWKTYTEFTYLFRNWEESEKEHLVKIFENLFTLTERDNEEKVYFDYNYLVLSKNTVRLLTDNQKEIYELLQGYGITRFVFVRQNIRATLLEPYATFFAFKDNVLRFRDIELFNKQKIDRPFFYFYYKKENGSELDAGKVIELLEKLHGMMKKKINERFKVAKSDSGSNEQKG